uniref:Paladin n=1 Tax=Gasterosteus aculeatus aculeatus TaxID=481459 RepID=G3NCI0_GASAC
MPSSPTFPSHTMAGNKERRKGPGSAGGSSSHTCLWSMGTTASAAPQPVSEASPLESVHGNGMADSRQSLSMSPFQTVSIHNNKAKSIITNKVAPVVITYNCRQEFQIHDEILKTNYKVGRISDALPEHYLVQGEFFMVQDVYSKADVLNTTGSCGAPNFRQVRGSYPLYGMGQPSLNGFKRVLQRLQALGHQVIFFCVREEPVVFLHKDDDFVPYTPRRKENLHENLHGLEKEELVEKLELTIRKELHDFAKLNEDVFYVYNDIEHFKDEPQKVSIASEEDIHVTEEVYKRPVFTMPAYRLYHRLPLPMEGAPLEEDFDAFVSILRESPSLSLGHHGGSRPPPALLFSCQVGVGRTNLAMILGTLVMNRLRGDSQPHIEEDAAANLCSEMHNIKEAIYENKRKLEGIGEDYQIQGSSTKDYFLNRTMQSLERYFYLIVFNAYLREQYPLAFVSNFSQWMCSHAWLYRLLARMDLSELSAPAELVTRGARCLAPDVLSTVKEMKAANFRRVPKMPIYGMAQPTSEATGAVLAHLTDEKRKHGHVLWVNLQEELVLEGNGQILTPREPSCPDHCLTVQEIFNQHKSSQQGLVSKRIPLPDCSAPREEDFDKLLEAMKTSLAEDSHSAFVFNCSNGKGRTTTAMVVSVLTLWHFNVVMQLVRLLPDGHRMKREVDMALDSVSETMTPMHYHLREIIICTYRQIKSGKTEKESQQLLLRSLQYLERYIYLILFNTYLHLEKKDSWQRSFTLWMEQTQHTRTHVAIDLQHVKLAWR